MGFMDLLIVALMPMLKILLITGAGLVLSLESINVLGQNATTILNNIVYFLFNPALMLSILAESITFQTLITLWFIPVLILLIFITGSALAWILIKITRTPPHLQGLVIGCCSAGNFILPLIIVPSVCEESNSPFGDSATCSTNAKAYVSLAVAVGSIYIWTYTFSIMSLFADKRNQDDLTNDSTITINVSSGQTSDTCTQPLLPSTQIELPRTASKVPLLDKMSQCIKMIAPKINLKMLFAPSTIAAIVGFVIGTITPIRNAMIGHSAPLRVIDSSISSVGDAAIPSMILILGANLLGGLRKSGMQFSLIIGIIAVRYILLPLLGIVVVKGAQHFGLVGSDPLYQFALLIQFATPPAINIGTMAQFFDMSNNECSVIMLWTYVVGSFSLTIWTTIYMWLLA